ncbi:MAG: NAD(P)H-flavin reductase [Legionellales bacterium]|nr:NAD(P)H-flavin reductase [Legionellales bacterium]
MTHRTTEARVETITPITDSILQLILAPDEYIDYQAGQYLQMTAGTEPQSYSIANAPLGSHHYELHIRHKHDNLQNKELLTHIKHRGTVSIRLPLGTCDLNHLDPNKPILFLARGTGFAPIKAMIEQLLADGGPRPFELYWGAHSQSDLYMDDKVLHWQAHVNHFQYLALSFDDSQDSLVSRAISRHPKDLVDWQIVFSGPFDMAHQTRDQLLAAGASEQYLFSDAYTSEGE